MNEKRSPAPGLDAVRRALDVLACWRLRDWVTIAGLAGDAPVMVWDVLTVSGVWETLPEHERAALHWCLADGRRISRAWPLSAGIEEYRPQIIALCVDVAHFAVLCDPERAKQWPEADPARGDEVASAVALLRQYAALPVVWRAAVLRQMQHHRRRLLPGPAAYANVLADATTRARNGQPPPPPDYADLRTIDGPELVHRIAFLPHPWQVEVMRRIAAGADPVQAESDAGRAIDDVRDYGVRAGSCSRR
ncbi:hypothetical protein ACH41E_02595 [Streptomyces sp. NPDC020412]|uniref:hypothetical protein n=1 Tax=Streptomyces sp. NPDC020412 TaxID=3365073 RepID=UPI00379C5BFF